MSLIKKAAGNKDVTIEYIFDPDAMKLIVTGRHHGTSPVNRELVGIVQTRITGISNFDVEDIYFDEKPYFIREIDVELGDRIGVMIHYSYTEIGCDIGESDITINQK